MMTRVLGYCPMGCGETLYFEPPHIMCNDAECPDSMAVGKLLSENQGTWHILDVQADGVTTKHPIMERIDGGLFGCTVHDYAMSFHGPPVSLGMWKLRPARTVEINGETLYHPDDDAFADDSGYIWEEVK